MKKPFLAVVAAAGSAALLSACATSGQLSQANTHYAQGQFEQAIPLYKAAAAESKNAALANFRIGEAYRLSNRLDQAERYYKAALDAQVSEPTVGYRYAQALRAGGKFDEAAAQFASYAQTGTDRTLAARAATDAQAATASKALVGQAARYDVAPLDALNSSSSDFSASQRPGSNELVFASGRDGKDFPGNGENYLSLYANKFDDAETLSGGTPRKLEPIFNQAKTLQASATYSPDGNTMVFARSNDGSKKGFRSDDLWVSFFRNGAWSTPELVSVSDPTADDYAPAFAPDGTTLYFASNRAGGQGGADLYKASLDANGTFSAAENLGAAVNTPANDNFPGVAPDGTLYFASDGQPGYGKLDLFRYQNGKVTNLGPELNSAADDFAPFFTGADRGVFSSNRAGGKGSDDLYSFKKKPRKVATFYADGTLLERDERAGTTIPAANGTVTLTSANGQKISAVAGPDGKFTARLDSAQTYTLLADRAGDFAARTSLSTVGRTPSQDELTQPQTDVKLPVTLTLTKIVVNREATLKDIFYDYKKASIRPDAVANLDTLVQLLRDNPKINVELSAHTDQRGRDAYNLKLSQQRAETAVAYLVRQGIAKSRVTAKGYGESRPLVPNPKTEADYQRNRRTEFKVTRITQ